MQRNWFIALGLGAAVLAGCAKDTLHLVTIDAATLAPCKDVSFSVRSSDMHFIDPIGVILTPDKVTSGSTGQDGEAVIQLPRRRQHTIMIERVGVRSTDIWIRPASPNQPAGSCGQWFIPRTASCRSDGAICIAVPNPSWPRLIIELPKGYRGLLQVRKTPLPVQGATPLGSVVAHRAVNGVVEVESFLFGANYQENVFARFDDGETLPFAANPLDKSLPHLEPVGMTFPPDARGNDISSSSPVDELWIVGTAVDARAVNDRLYPAGLVSESGVMRRFSPSAVAPLLREASASAQ